MLQAPKASITPPRPVLLPVSSNASQARAIPATCMVRNVNRPPTNSIRKSRCCSAANRPESLGGLGSRIRQRTPEPLFGYATDPPCEAGPVDVLSTTRVNPTTTAEIGGAGCCLPDSTM